MTTYYMVRTEQGWVGAWPGGPLVDNAPAQFAYTYSHAEAVLVAERLGGTVVSS
jgi:hypothetical protein